MPDALSKTIPIWCAVLNRALFLDAKVATSLHTPPQSVSASEHAQIEQKLQQFVDQFKVSWTEQFQKRSV
jgi:tRNA A64-2'-O-ribosylphosphate transferase